MSPTKLLTYKSCCFLTSAFISFLKVSNFGLNLPLQAFFAFACVLFLLRIFLLISKGYPKDRRYQPTGFRGGGAAEGGGGYAYQQTLEQRKLSNQSFPELSNYPSNH